LAGARPGDRGARTRDDSLEEFFTRFPALLGREATRTEQAAFERYADLLVVWNRTHHLTSLRTRRQIGRGLFLDALLFRALFPPRPVRVADVGAGAGIPGLPIRVIDPTVSLTLIDSRRKPISFLHAVARELELHDVQIRHARVEELTEAEGELNGTFDLVLTRSVGLKPSFIRSSLLLLRPGGQFIAAGPPSDKLAPIVGWSGLAEWKTISFDTLGMTRRFFVARQEA